MQLTSWIAFRYLLSRRSGRFAPLLTITAVASVATGMLSFIVVMSVMQGFRAELAERLLGFGAHITLVRGAGAEEIDRDGLEGILAKLPVRDASPFVQGEVIALSEATGELSALGARVRGIDPGAPGAMGKVDFYFPEGSAGPASMEPDGRGIAGAVIGSDVVSSLSVHPDFNDEIDLVAPLAEVTPSGELGPNKRRLRVAGVFRTGVFEYDGKYILVPLAEASKLLGEQAEEGWFIRLKETGEVPAILSKIRERLPEGWSGEGWHEQNRKLFAALKLERVAMGGVLVMVLAIASFAVVGVVLLITAAKRKDIAILESIGMTPRGIGRVFLLHAAFIGAAGSAVGLAAGLAACFAMERWPIRLPASYYLDYLPVEASPWISAAVALGGVAIAIISAAIPVRQAIKLNPVEVIRYE